MFKLDLIELPKLVRNDGEIRTYQSPTGQSYPSVTTVLSKTKDMSHLNAWRDRMGHDVADEITRKAASRGTATHLLCEKLVLNQEYDLREEMPISVHLFKQLEKFLVANVDDIRSSEGTLYSHKLKVAGSVDLVASYRGQPAIVDFKTSTRLKKPEWIEDYFMQVAMYSYMFYEMTQLHHPKLVVAIAVEEENEPQIFEEDVNDWIDKAAKRCKQFHKENKI